MENQAANAARTRHRAADLVQKSGLDRHGCPHCMRGRMAFARSYSMDGRRSCQSVACCHACARAST